MVQSKNATEPYGKATALGGHAGFLYLRGRYEEARAALGPSPPGAVKRPSCFPQ